MKQRHSRVTIAETFGLTDPATGLKDAIKAVFGEGKIPPTRFDLSSMSIFKPQISIPTWLGITRRDRLVPIYNLYNRRQPGPDEPFSVRVTFARDFRGGKMTYDSHLGTDFAIPVGTEIVTCAPGRVIRVVNQLDHGGLKIHVDHGAGLITTYGHLSRALVSEGDEVGRSESIALSGAAGVELITFFPWVSPHLHLTILLNGAPADPFAVDGETPLWIGGNDPAPHSGAPDREFTPTPWREELIDAAIAECVDENERRKLAEFREPARRAAEALNHYLFFNTIFKSMPPLYETVHPRAPLLDLPFRAEDFDGIWLPAA